MKVIKDKILEILKYFKINKILEVLETKTRTIYADNTDEIHAHH